MTLHVQFKKYSIHCTRKLAWHGMAHWEMCDGLKPTGFKWPENFIQNRTVD